MCYIMTPASTSRPVSEARESTVVYAYFRKAVETVNGKTVVKYHCLHCRPDARPTRDGLAAVTICNLNKHQEVCLGLKIAWPPGELPYVTL